MIIIDEKILGFIKSFSSFGKEVIDCFTCGNCYWFAQILKERFGNIIVYNPIVNHFASRRRQYIYDITGCISNEGYYDWEWYKTFEPVESVRIIEQCIMKGENNETN